MRLREFVNYKKFYQFYIMIESVKAQIVAYEDDSVNSVKETKLQWFFDVTQGCKLLEILELEMQVCNELKFERL